jgi:hypothetical protein
LKEQSSVEKTVRNKGPVATSSSRQNLKESKSQSKVIKIETPEESRLATDAYTQIGLPSFYKLDKLSYNRSEIADILSNHFESVFVKESSGSLPVFETRTEVSFGIERVLNKINNGEIVKRLKILRRVNQWARPNPPDGS